jgi:hypothetical protein
MPDRTSQLLLASVKPGLRDCGAIDRAGSLLVTVRRVAGAELLAGVARRITAFEMVFSGAAPPIDWNRADRFDATRSACAPFASAQESMLRNPGFFVRDSVPISCQRLGSSAADSSKASICSLSRLSDLDSFRTILGMIMHLKAVTKVRYADDISGGE